MAYNSAELRLLTERFAADGQNIWTYDDTVVAATVIAAGYISDAHKRDGGRGMEVGDLVVYRRFASLATKTSITSISLHVVTAVTQGQGATLSAAIDGTATVSALLSGTATPDANLDAVDGAAIGTIYVETDVQEPYVAVSVASGAARWLSMANDAVLGPMRATTLTSAGQTLYRTVAPFAGRITGFRGLVQTACTGATDKLVRLVVSGNTVSSGTLTFGDGDAIGSRYAATPTTDNIIAAGQQITIQSGAQPCATGVFDFYVVCRRMATS